MTGVAGACLNSASPGFRSYLPDCRAYELVSPMYKEGSPVFPEGISEGGEQLRIESIGSFANPDNTSKAGQSYIVKRAESGWESSPLDVPFLMYPAYHVEGMSSNFEHSLWFASGPGQFPTDVYLGLPGSPPDEPLTRMGPGAPEGVRESGFTFAGGSSDLLHVLLRDHSPEGSEEDQLWPGDTTSEGRLLSLYEYEGIGHSEPRLVGVSNEGVPKSIAASTLISNCGTSLGSAPWSDAYNAVSSSGAMVFFTANACGGSPAVNEVDARIDARKTLAISEPAYPLAQGSGSGPEECNAACEAAPRESGVFQGASEDGSKVFFLTSQPLLNSDKDTDTDLYEAEIKVESVEGEEVHARIGKLVQMSHDSNAGRAAEVQGVARVSEDGSHVYFIAGGRLTSGPRGGGKIGVDEGLDAEGICLASLSPAEKIEEAEAEAQEEKGEEVTVGARCRPKKGGENLYVYERDALYPSGHTSFVATLSKKDEADWHGARGNGEDVRPVQATPDGHFVVFQSTADLTSDEEGQEEAGQLFEYDAQTEALVRVSHGENGYNDNGNTNQYPAAIPVQFYENSTPEGRFRNLAVSEDGSQIFFSSAEALTPQAQALNGVCIYREYGVCVSYANNIYEYHDGQVSLISDGHDAVSVSENPATALIGTDESGRDVYFTTADSLVPQDGDTQVDIYDAREGGGFPAPPEPASCSGDFCQGAASAAPALLPPLTSAVAGETAVSVPGAGSPTKPKIKAKVKPRKRKLKKRKGKVHKGKRAAKGGR